MSECNVPTAIYAGGHDWLADPQDVENSILPYLPNIISTKKLDTWNHLDFVWGIQANKMMYTDIVERMRKRSS